MTRTQKTHAQRVFLEHFAKMGNVSAAARHAGIERKTVYRWQEADDTFAAAYREAELSATEVLEAEAWRRAVEGVPHERTSYWKGEISGTDIETRYSDALMITLLKARAPEKYRERFDVTSQGQPIVKAYSESDLALL
jgi:hypothetical protein